MFEILPQSTGAQLAIRASGKLGAEDYEKVLYPKLNELFKVHKVRHTNNYCVLNAY